MKAEDVTATLDLALQVTGAEEAEPAPQPRLLSDNGSGYIAADLAKWLVACFNALDALRFVRDGIWEIVILDRVLPGDIDGLHIVDTMRRLGDTTPVIVLSALDSLEERLRGLPASPLHRAGRQLL